MILGVTPASSTAPGCDLTRVGVDETRPSRPGYGARGRRAAMRAFDRDSARGAAERSAALLVDSPARALEHGHGIEPSSVDYPALRRYAAQLAAAAPPRPWASLRHPFFLQVDGQLGDMAANPAACFPLPGSRSVCAHAQAEAVAAPHGSFHHHARAARPRVFSWPSVGLRAEDFVDLELSQSTMPPRSGGGKGAQQVRSRRIPRCDRSWLFEAAARRWRGRRPIRAAALEVRAGSPPPTCSAAACVGRHAHSRARFTRSADDSGASGPASSQRPRLHR